MQMLGCTFTDENEPRPVFPLAPDVNLLAAPCGDNFTVVAHFDAPEVGVPATRVDWLDEQVTRAAQRAGVLVSPVRDVHVGV